MGLGQTRGGQGRVEQLRAGQAVPAVLFGRLQRGPGRALDAVHDACAGQPQAKLPEPDANGGRGLFLVAAIADRWAVAARGGPGKQVWAELSVKGR